MHHALFGLWEYLPESLLEGRLHMLVRDIQNLIVDDLQGLEGEDTRVEDFNEILKVCQRVLYSVLG